MTTSQRKVHTDTRTAQHAYTTNVRVRFSPILVSVCQSYISTGDEVVTFSGLPAQKAGLQNTRVLVIYCLRHAYAVGAWQLSLHVESSCRMARMANHPSKESSASLLASALRLTIHCNYESISAQQDMHVVVHISTRPR